MSRTRSTSSASGKTGASTAASLRLSGTSGLRPQQVVDRLAAADQPRTALGGEHGGGAGDAVVIRRHSERVGPRRRNGEQVAAARSGQSDVVDQDIARLAMHTCDADAIG